MLCSILCIKAGIKGKNNRKSKGSEIMNINKTELSKGVNLHFLKTEKFKTNMISVVRRLPLCRETATRAALVPRVLKRGTEKYPTLADISKKAEELYGASISAGTMKKGDNQLVVFTVQFVSDSFISGTITDEIIELLAEFVLNPKTVDGGFDSEFVRQEKTNLKNFIEGLINDKKAYAAAKCNEVMFEGDPYGIYEYGYVDDLDGIDEKNLYDFYKNLIKNSAVEVFASGSFDTDKVKTALENKLGKALGERYANDIKSGLAVYEDGIEVKRVTEEMPTSQSKLVMGFNCGIEPTSREYYALMMFSCIFGGSPFSKLFNNVREKLSLAYYVFSALDRQKSCMKISAGIEADKFDAAYDEIFIQLEKMKIGDFTDDEITSAKKYLATGMGSIKDSMGATEDFYMGQILLGSNETIDGLTECLNAVSRNEIIAAANAVQLDTVYFLKGVGSSEA